MLLKHHCCFLDITLHWPAWFIFSHHRSLLSIILASSETSLLIHELSSSLTSMIQIIPAASAASLLFRQHSSSLTSMIRHFPLSLVIKVLPLLKHHSCFLIIPHHWRAWFILSHHRLFCERFAIVLISIHARFATDVLTIRQRCASDLLAIRQWTSSDLRWIRGRFDSDFPASC